MRPCGSSRRKPPLKTFSLATLLLLMATAFVGVAAATPPNPCNTNLGCPMPDCLSSGQGLRGCEPTCWMDDHGVTCVWPSAAPTSPSDVVCRVESLVGSGCTGFPCGVASCLPHCYTEGDFIRCDWGSSASPAVACGTGPVWVCNWGGLFGCYQAGVLGHATRELCFAP